MTISLHQKNSSTQSYLQPPDPTKVKKLDLKTIFTQLGEMVCRVSTVKGECSGLLLGGKKLLVPFHTIGWKEIKKQSDEKANFDVYPLRIDYKENIFTALYSDPKDLEVARYYDSCLFEIVDDDFQEPNINSLDLFTEALAPGDKVYLAGYPLGQEEPSFHKGIVSSVNEGVKITWFNIDAPLLPGFSGGPVFIKREEKIYLAGIILSEHAAIDSSFLEQRPDIQANLMKGGVHVRGVNVGSVISNMIDTVLDNFATGIGRILSIKHVKDLQSSTKPPTIPSTLLRFSFPIVKGERLPGELGTNADYANWYHREVKGKQLCLKILGKIIYAADKIDSEEEKEKLRPYYLNNVHSHATKGHETFKQTLGQKLETLEDKILSAKRGSLEKNKNIWINLLEQYKTADSNLAEKCDKLLSDLKVSP